MKSFFYSLWPMLQSEYINLNDKNRRLKVKNSKLVSRNACTEISLVKAKANKFAKSEEVKSLQSVINLLTPQYPDKDNQSDLHIKSRLIGALHGGKNDEPEDPGSLCEHLSSTSSVIGIPDRPFQDEKIYYCEKVTEYTKKG
ncbi:hypothetical protein C1646_770085 [Rhizophagus diaphanus]|nr:hypothetical protein C1646_770085 [Rhizophagus diaphanus] [Rhizophagus sp. MUCL 43196]